MKAGQHRNSWGTPSGPLVIADLGVNHNGDVNTALALIEAAKEAGCDLVTLQKRTIGEKNPLASPHSSRETPWGLLPDPDYWKRVELDFGDYRRIDARCKTLGIEWMASSGDALAHHFLERLRVHRHEVPLALLGDEALRTELLKRRKALLIEADGAELGALGEVAILFRSLGGSLGIVERPSSGTATDAGTDAVTDGNSRLARLESLREAFPWASIGYSRLHPDDADESATLHAVASGAAFVEIPITLDRRTPGVAHATSLEPAALERLVRAVRDVAANPGGRALPPARPEGPGLERRREASLPPVVRSRERRRGEGGHCGLDFGTSNSEIGVYEEGAPRLIPLERGADRIPSTIFFEEAQASPLFGTAAIDRYLSGEKGRLFWSIKSVLGTSLMVPPGDRTWIHGKETRFRDLVGAIIGHVKTVAENRSGQRLTQVVLGRPVRFSDDDDAYDRMAAAMLVECAKSQGFEEVVLEYEPVAAALDYERSVTGEVLALVADVGGGTTDFSVLRLGPDRIRKHDRREDVLGTGGVHLGGTDFDAALSLRNVMPQLGRGAELGATAKPQAARAAGHERGRAATRGRRGSHDLDRRYPMPDWIYQSLASWLAISQIYESPLLDNIYGTTSREKGHDPRFARLEKVLRENRGHQLARLVESSKIELSTRGEAGIDPAQIEAGWSVRVRREEFEEAIRDHLRRIELHLTATVRSAGVNPAEIEVAILTGGGAAVPAVRAAVQRACPGARLAEGDQFGGIAIGLTLRARSEFGPLDPPT